MILGSTNGNINNDENEDDKDDDDDPHLKWVIPVASSLGSVILVLCIVFACLQYSEQKRTEKELAFKIGKFK